MITKNQHKISQVKKDLAILSLSILGLIISISFLLQDTAIKYTNTLKVQEALKEVNNNAAFVHNHKKELLANPINALTKKQKMSHSIEEDKTFNINSTFKTPYVHAKSFSVYDALHQEEVAAKESNQILPLASLTKIFTALAVNEYLDDSDIVTINQEDLNTEGNSGLVLNSHWNPKELARFMLMVSSNDAASALARKLEEKTNKKFQDIIKKMINKIGLNASFVINPSGLDISSETSGAYGTAKELSQALAYAVLHAPDIFNITSKEEFVFYDEEGNEYKVKNTNKNIENIFNAVASKTGYTDLAGGNLSVAFEIEPGHIIVITVLGSDKQNRFKDVEKLYNALLDFYAK